MTTRAPADQVSLGRDGLHYFEAAPFTGVAYSLAPSGAVVSEIEYRDGLRSGRCLGWYRDGSPLSESTYFMGGLHGLSREWHRNGQIAEECEAEYGIVLRRRTWEEDGALTEDYELREGDQAHERLLEYRRIYAQQGSG